MNTKSLLIFSALIELATGAALLIAPQLVAKLLLGHEIGSAEGTIVARVAGAALFAIGVNCWLEKNSPSPRTGLIAGLLAYNFLVAGLLIYAAVGEKIAGIALWPAVALHAGFGIWCVVRIGIGA